MKLSVIAIACLVAGATALPDPQKKDGKSKLKPPRVGDSCANRHDIHSQYDLPRYNYYCCERVDPSLHTLSKPDPEIPYYYGVNCHATTFKRNPNPRLETYCPKIRLADSSGRFSDQPLTACCRKESGKFVCVPISGQVE